MGTVALANGDVVRHIQFTISKRYYGVLREHATGGTDIWDFDFMLLNIYVMPEKGYVVRRIDECLPDGTIKVRYDSLDFVDRGDGIYFPSVFVEISVWGRENRAQATKYEILEATMLNEEIPDRYFDRPLLMGTRIRDWRASALDEHGNPRHFHTTRDGYASELDVLYEEWKEAEEARQKAVDTLVAGLEKRKAVNQSVEVKYQYKTYKSRFPHIGADLENNATNRYFAVSGDDWTEGTWTIKDGEKSVSGLQSDDEFTLHEYLKHYPPVRVVQGGVVPWEALLNYLVLKRNDAAYASGVVIEEEGTGEKYLLGHRQRLVVSD